MTELQQFEDTPIRPLRRVEYELLIEHGLISEDDQVELIEGILVAMSPQSSRHAEIIIQLTRIFIEGLGGRASVRAQTPIALSDTSEPEPDLALVAPGDYFEAHPTTAWLVIEVAGDSLRKDRVLKNRLYSASGIPEYWIINVPAREIEVYREPSPDGYRTVTHHTPGEHIACLQFPDVDIDIARLLGSRDISR